jgi:hypothetical protein
MPSSKLAVTVILGVLADGLMTIVFGLGSTTSKIGLWGAILGLVVSLQNHLRLTEAAKKETDARLQALQDQVSEMSQNLTKP